MCTCPANTNPNCNTFWARTALTCSISATKCSTFQRTTSKRLDTQAQAREDVALNDMDDMRSSAWDIATITDDRLMDLLPQYKQNADRYSGEQEALASQIGGALDSSSGNIRSLLSGLKSKFVGLQGHEHRRLQYYKQ